ncbi:hypothetical protein STEG23_008696, partial [Scotinomys teguina]
EMESMAVTFQTFPKGFASFWGKGGQTFLEAPGPSFHHGHCCKLLDLFIQWDWSTYLADYGQPNCKYLRVNPVTALTLLEKMKDTSRKNNMFAQFRKNERDKQKLIDTVAKQLRGLISSHHS